MVINVNKLKRLLSIRPVKITHTKGEWSKSTIVWLYYDDPSIGVQWPLEVVEMSPRDLKLPRVDDSFQGFSLDEPCVQSS